MPRQQHPSKSLGKSMAGVDEPGKVLHKDITLFAPFLDGECWFSIWHPREVGAWFVIICSIGRSISCLFRFLCSQCEKTNRYCVLPDAVFRSASLALNFWWSWCRPTWVTLCSGQGPILGFLSLIVVTFSRGYQKSYCWLSGSADFLVVLTSW